MIMKENYYLSSNGYQIKMYNFHNSLKYTKFIDCITHDDYNDSNEKKQPKFTREE